MPLLYVGMVVWNVAIYVMEGRGFKSQLVPDCILGHSLSTNFITALHCFLVINTIEIIVVVVCALCQPVMTFHVNFVSQHVTTSSHLNSCLHVCSTCHNMYNYLATTEFLFKLAGHFRQKYVYNKPQTFHMIFMMQSIPWKVTCCTLFNYIFTGNLH